jgi:hypothetical protein
MKHKWSPGGWTPRLAPLAAVFLTAALLAAPLTASAVPVLLGASLYYTGGDVDLDLLYSGTAYGEVLQLRSAFSIVDVADGSVAGSHVTLSAKELADMGIGVGDELQFGIHVKNTGHDFVLGAGDRNADGLAHAYLRASPSSGIYAGFEDFYGGGDRDFNDTILRFTRGASTTAPRGKSWQEDLPVSTIPEPSTLLLMLSGIGMIGVCVRKS